MYIVKTSTSDSIKIDYDELALIPTTAMDSLIFFRRGAILRRLISAVVEDEDAVKEMMRRPDESDESLLQRLREKKSPDIFEHIRKPQLPEQDRPRLT